MLRTCVGNIAITDIIDAVIFLHFTGLLTYVSVIWSTFILGLKDNLSPTVAPNHLQGPHRESPKAMSKLSDTTIDGHLGQRRYQSRKNEHI